MIELTTGNILTSKADALVNTVNCVGVMGRGIALQFKKAFPDNFTAYERACKAGQVLPGKMFIFETGRIEGPRFIVNFPTKRHWRNVSRMDDIEAGLRDLAKVLREKNIRSVAVPPLGCGLGGLKWDDVRPRIEKALGSLNGITVMLFAPSDVAGVAEKQPEMPFKMTPGRAALIELAWRYLSAVLEPDITLLEIHKLMYFMQEAGEPLRLRFVQAPHGPYAENLRHVLRCMEGQMLDGYGDGGDAPSKPISFRPHAVSEAHTVLAQNSDSMARVDRVAALIHGFESAFGMELLATVHWVIHKMNTIETADIIRLVYQWGPQKKKFSSRQIELAARHLKECGWA